MERYREAYVTDSLNRLVDKTSVLLCQSPKFIDKTGYLPWQNLELVFYGINESLRRLRGRLGEEAFEKLTTLSDEMRACFEADPEDRTGETRKGQSLALDMRDVIVARMRQLKALGCSTD